MSASPMLPTEIWLLIFEELCQCPHCHSHRIFDFSLSVYEQGKSDLVALSLTSRAIRDMSEPVLYHCFYGYPYQNTLSKFLRTLVSQPRLASFIRALYLPEDLYARFVLKNAGEFLTRRHIESWNQASVRSGVPTPRWLIQALAEDEPSDVAEFDGAGPDSQLRFKNPKRHYRIRSSMSDLLLHDLRAWQQLLAVGICSSSLTYLAIMAIHGSVRYDQSCVDLLGPARAKFPFDFSNLRAISCAGVASGEDFHRFILRAPRLNYISVGVASGPKKLPIEWLPPSSFTNVKTISIACRASYQGNILRVCNQVQDLELHFLEGAGRPQLLPGMAAPSESPMLDPWPASAKKQLRRLCWSSSVAYTTLNTIPTEDEGLSMFPPLADFKSLEVLEIDRKSLDVCLIRERDPNMSEEEIARQFPTILPGSLRILRMVFLELSSWSWLVVELEELASAKKSFLPMLSVVQIDWEPWLMPWFSEDEKPLSEVMDALGVVSAMKDVGIELRFGLRSFSYRGLNHPLPANLDAFLKGCGLVIYPR